MCNNTVQRNVSSFSLQLFFSVSLWIISFWKLRGFNCRVCLSLYLAELPDICQFFKPRFNMRIAYF